MLRLLQVNALVLGTTHRYRSKYVTTVSFCHVELEVFCRSMFSC